MADTRGVAESAPLYGRAQTRSVCFLVPERSAASFRRSAASAFVRFVGGDPLLLEASDAARLPAIATLGRNDAVLSAADTGRGKVEGGWG